MDENLKKEIQSATLVRLMSHLDERSKDIISSRWLTEKKETLHELADRYNVSAERIRQIEANAIKKLRLSMI